MRGSRVLSRRRLIELGVGAGVAALAGVGRAVADAPRRTPGQILGPYFPVTLPRDADADMTRVAGRPGRAEGRVVQLSGRILDERGRTVPRARITIWQANARGRYAHASDHNPAALDPNFEGAASIESDADGRWSLTTIKPAAYPDDGAGGMRAPHIHFDVTGRVNRLVTQMYFDGEALNDGDRVLAFAGGNRGRLIVPFAAGVEGALQGTWDIVLRDG